MVVEELITLLGFKADVGEASKAQRAYDLVRTSAVALVGAATAATAAVAGLVASVAADVDVIGKTADALGLQAESLQELAFAFQITGSSQEEAITGLRTFAKATEDVIRGAGEALPYIQRMGLSAADFANLGLEERLAVLAERWNELPRGPEQSAAAMALFGRAGLRLVPFLQAGPEGVARLRAEFEELGVVLSREEIGLFETFNDNLARAGAFMTGLTRMVALGLVPAFLDLQDRLLAWIRANRETIQLRLTQVFELLADFVFEAGEALAVLVDLLGKATEAFEDTDQAIAGVKTGLIFLSSYMAVTAAPAVLTWVASLGKAAIALDLVKIKALAAQAAIFLMPLAIAALITAAVLIVDDLVTYVQGGESAFGSLLETMRATGPTLASIADFLDYIFGGGLGEQTYDAFVKIRDMVKEVFDGIVEGFSRIPAAIRAAVSALGGALTAVPRGLLAAGRQAYGLATGAQSSVADSVSRTYAPQQSVMFNAGGNTFNFGSSGAPVADINRALDMRDRSLAEQSRAASQSLIFNGELY